MCKMCGEICEVDSVNVRWCSLIFRRFIFKRHIEILAIRKETKVKIKKAELHSRSETKSVFEKVNPESMLPTDKVTKKNDAIMERL